MRDSRVATTAIMNHRYRGPGGRVRALRVGAVVLSLGCAMCMAPCVAFAAPDDPVVSADSDTSADPNGRIADDSPSGEAAGDSGTPADETLESGVFDPSPDAPESPGESDPNRWQGLPLPNFSTGGLFPRISLPWDPEPGVPSFFLKPVSGTGYAIYDPVPTDPPQNPSGVYDPVPEN